MLLFVEENAWEVEVKGLTRVIVLGPGLAEVMVSASAAPVCVGMVIVLSILAFPPNTQFVSTSGEVRVSPSATVTSAAKAPGATRLKHDARLVASNVRRMPTVVLILLPIFVLLSAET